MRMRGNCPPSPVRGGGLKNPPDTGTGNGQQTEADMSPHFARALKFAESQQNGGKAHDWTLSQLHELAFELQQTHDMAIHQAAMIAMSWSKEAGGGSGQGGEGYANLAEAINKLKVDK